MKSFYNIGKLALLSGGSGENRLLALTAEELNKLRQQAGAAAVNTTKPLGTTARSAQDNAARQVDTHQRSLGVQQLLGANERLTDTQQYFAQNPGALAEQNAQIARLNQSQKDIDTAAGVTTNRTTNPIKDMLSQSLEGAVDARRQGFDLIKPGQPMVDEFGNPTAAGRLNQGASAGQNITYDPATGQVMNPTQSLQANVAARKQTRLEELQAQKAGLGSADPNAPDYAVNQAKIEDTRANIDRNIMTEETNQKNDSKTRSDANSSASAQAGETADAGLMAAVANLPPELQFLGPILQTQLSGLQQSIDQQGDLAKAQLQGGTVMIDGKPVQVSGVQSVADQIDKKISAMESSYATMTDKMQGMLDTLKESQEKTLTEQEQSAKDRLGWQEQQMVRKAEDDKRKAVDQRIASLALRGGFGSSAGLQEIDSARMEYEKEINNMQLEFGVQRTELSAKYSALHNEVLTNYTRDSMANVKELYTTLERLEGQSWSNMQAKAKEEANILGAMVTNQTALRNEYAKELSGGAKEIAGMIVNKQLTDRQKQNDAWNQLIQLKTLFGSNVPPSLLKGIAKHIPGMSVDDVAGFKTWAEMKEAMEDGVDSSYNDLITRLTEPEPGETGIPHMSLVVDRVARSYGKSADERAEYKKVIAQQLANGMSQEDLMKTLETDFWLSQKGNVLTSHDARQNVLGGITNIEGYLQKYGITEDNDGPLGAVSSRMQGALSVIGMSGADYNEISAAIGNLRSEIIKDRYGSAVTDSELAIARSFLPDIRDKGPKFMANVRNLKVYTKYLDQKYLNRSLDLPEPPDPTGATPDAGAHEGYSTEDILNIMGAGATIPQTSRVSSDDLISANIGGRNVRGQSYPITALQAADAAFFADTGKHIKVNQDLRSSEYQAALYEKYQSGKGGRAAPPGHSFHEKGLALDVTNWKEAAPYLKRYGLVNGLKDDMGHFSVGEMNPDFLKALSQYS